MPDLLREALALEFVDEMLMSVGAEGMAASEPVPGDVLTMHQSD